MTWYILLLCMQPLSSYAKILYQDIIEIYHVYGKRQLEISKKSEKTKIELRVRSYKADFADQNKIKISSLAQFLAILEQFLCLA